MPKRKRLVLTIKQKLEILEASKSGRSGLSLSEKYGVGTSTISRIIKNGEVLSDYSSKLLEEGVSSNCKVMKNSKIEEVEDALYVWFVQKRGIGYPISGPLLCENAVKF
uniref:HTH CENPB-type domain-containing protein n=1 Tax=Trichuris muris TaxID=70415 RepID=A0A5S6Q5V2_TRIMR